MFSHHFIIDYSVVIGKFQNNHENRDVKCVEELKLFERVVTMYPVIVSVLVLASTVSSTPPPPRIRSLSGQVMV